MQVPTNVPEQTSIISRPTSTPSPTTTTTPQPLSPRAFQTKLSNIFLMALPFEEKAKRILDELQKQTPDSVQKLFEFIAKHQDKIVLMRDKGWEQLRQELGPQMKVVSPGDGCSFESFREEAVHTVTEVCLSALKALGNPDPGQHEATGTPGYQSDIDTVFLDPKGMTEEVKITEKILFDLVWNAAFKGLSGKEADVEGYLNHPGAAYNTYCNCAYFREKSAGA